MNCKKCGKKLPLLKKLCDDCRKEYQKNYAKKNNLKKRETNKEYMRARRWLDGGERRDDMAPVIKKEKKKKADNNLECPLCGTVEKKMAHNQVYCYNCRTHHNDKIQMYIINRRNGERKEELKNFRAEFCSKPIEPVKNIKRKKGRLLISTPRMKQE